MSLAAAEYYQTRANRLDMGIIPEVLEGEPVLLLGTGPADYLSLQSPNQQVLTDVATRYAETTAAAAKFAMAAYTMYNPGAPIPDRLPGRQRRSFNRHCELLFTRLLFPVHLKAGRITDIQIEALARDEIDESLLSRAGASNGEWYKPEHEDAEVYLLTTAALRAGRPLGYVSCMTVVSGSFTNFGNGTEQSPLRPVTYARYSAAADKRNNLLAKSGLEQSRAIRNVIDVYGLQRPLIQPVMRSQSDRGHRLR